jgi:hypothetical protein
MVILRVIYSFSFYLPAMHAGTHLGLAPDTYMPVRNNHEVQGRLNQVAVEYTQ